MFAPSEESASAYNMKAVVEATGVRAETLRSWERRFHVLQPARTSSGYRKYSHQDVQTIRWLQARLAEGFTIARAVELLRVSGDRKMATPDVRTPATVSRDLVTACRNLDETGAERALAEALTLFPPEQMCLSVVSPALITLGDHGVAHRGEMGPAHFAGVLIRARLLSLYGWAGGTGRGGPLVLLAGAPGEPHDLGLLMVALFARRAGLRTLFLGAGVDAHVIATTVASRQPAAVCLSASGPESAGAAFDVACRLTTPAGSRYPSVLLGGSGVRVCERDAAHPGITLSAGDAGQAVRTLLSITPE